MKYKLVLLLIIYFSINSSAFAQKKMIRFQSINSFAIVGGESKVSTAFQSINGIRFSDWFSGIGIGVDNYNYKALPLFYDVRRYFGTDRKAFIYGDLGYNFSMKNKPGKEMIHYGNYNYHFKGGLYSELGIGFKTKFIKKSSILFSVAHSYKQLQGHVGIVPECVGCDHYWYNYKLSYGRILLKTGVEF